MKRTLMMGCAFLAIFGIALFGGRSAAAWMDRWNTPAPVALGDHREWLQSADADIVLFSLSTCPYCRQAREWLDGHDVRFKELLIDTSPEAQRLFDQMKEKAVPVLVTRDRRVRGFSAGDYFEALAAHADSMSANGASNPGAR